MAAHTYSGDPEQFKNIWEKGYTFDLGALINRGWELFKANAANFVLFSVIFMVALGSLEAFNVNDGLSGLIQLLITAPLTAGFYIVADKVARNEKTEFGDFFKGFDHMVQLIIGNLVYTVLVVFGMILLVFPGIYLAIAYMIWMPFVLFEDLKFWDALETSRKIVTKNWWNFLLLTFAFLGIILLGIIALGVGVFVAVPVIYCTSYAVYESIVGKHRSFSDKIDEIGIEIEEINDFDDV